MCKNVELKLNFNKQVLNVKYPVRVPKALNDEFEQKCDMFDALTKQKDSNFVSKHLYKYTWNEQEFSVNHLPIVWKDLGIKMLELVEKLNGSSSLKMEKENREYLVIKLPEAIPVSCHATHLHKFDNIETVSEPKVIYLDNTWYK